jgi:hypothetical protein
MYIIKDLYTFQTRESSFELELAVLASHPIHTKTPNFHALGFENDAYPKRTLCTNRTAHFIKLRSRSHNVPHRFLLA